MINEYGNDQDFKLFTKWSIRKITFIGILIAISVAFFLIVFQFMPFISLPAYKISVIGLPIKITGLIFGPIIGAFVGVVSDLISFLFVPSLFNPLFILAAALDGIIPGIIGFVFLKLLKFLFGGRFQDSYYADMMETLFKRLDKLYLDPIVNAQKIKKIENRIINLYYKRKELVQKNNKKRDLLNINMVVGTTVLAIIMLLVTWLIGFKIDEHTIQGGIITNRWVLLGIMLSGYVAMLVFIVIARFKLKSSLYLIIVPIVVFSALIELANVPILSLAEKKSIEQSGSAGSIFVYMFQHIILSPVKIWGNMFIIFFTYKIVSPLIYKNHDITY
ncbi:ECF transporter S component [Mycoplasma zalophidermidis]|uniref:ECF transporter S component n=1 Tax=Mycoplasma zalophidermidis TaxID=398174 RepID=A0ABS6DRB7_9MOLU|nr:ECF transporter S component [Mycoplasma zalophidermidis]MBU4689650.1 ECF transporter S component [Mycoplasma zalophidermidis]MBU4693550.1 ECF transporter S component [Mycoplasma zalophidermidis]MCR8966491.1 ECF transporter S component [Mycoplasma zalophidermidis]